MQTHHIEQILNRGRWFAKLPVNLQQALVKQGVLRQFQSGQRLFSRGDCADGLYAVLNGSVQIVGASKHGADDKHVILTLIDSPDWFGEICLFDRQPRTHDALADGPATILHVRQALLDQLIAENPNYWREFGLLLTQKVRLIFSAIEDAALLPTHTRLARRLLQMAEGYGIRSDSSTISARTLHVSQEKLSAMLSISRQTVNQMLKELEHDGLLQLGRGNIEILNLEGLKAKAQVS
ncbi:Crp/Fnr family transcriptional regulator [Limnobacter parvus]|uniref:Crp/Fnr family transcriptional regulator n=1 Tax=Limnobacter parvus TaxID=2939690 RepID=A0ABT1XLR0_9BURK|nr:Crp/Fnr family transcriptional regulator [Limnobacter parvus]MCR2747197.1 Crp/Fnr family transcriptional regulator [Limnobacter parvus]